MKKQFLLLAVSALLSQAAFADELANGMAAWNKQDFKEAAAIFSKLAAAGNAEAQLQLGEMYGFGEGVAEDPVQAAKLLNQAKANGNKEAAASLATLQERAGHKADIAFWVERYQGDEVRLSKFNCSKPELPKVSTTRGELKTVSAQVKTYLDCYGRFANSLASVLPAGKAIPENIAKLMSTTEFNAARARMEKIYMEEGTRAKAEAGALVAANDAWLKASEDYLTTQSKMMANKTEQDSQQRREREQSVSLDIVARSSGGGR